MNLFSSQLSAVWTSDACSIGGDSSSPTALLHKPVSQGICKRMFYNFWKGLKSGCRVGHTCLSRAGCRDCRLQNERWAVPALETFLSLVHASTQPHYREELLNVLEKKCHKLDGELQRLWDSAVLPVWHVSLLHVPWSWSSVILGSRAGTTFQCQHCPCSRHGQPHAGEVALTQRLWWG